MVFLWYKFENAKIHFLDLEISNCSIDIFRSPTHTGQYTRFDSFETWSRKTACMDYIAVSQSRKHMQ